MPKHQHNSYYVVQQPVRSVRRKRRWTHVVGGVLALVIAFVFAVGAVAVIVRPDPLISFLKSVNIEVPTLPGSGNAENPASSGAGYQNGGDRPSESRVFVSVNDRGASDTEIAEQERQSKAASRTPLIAQCSGVDLRLPVSMADLTGTLFHQASYDYALPLDSEVPAADYETVADTRTFRINHEQTAADGDWADTEILYIWRTTDATDVNTSIDVGALAGATVKSPVDGTVVLVRDYRLYDEMDDVEIHIQPKGRPDLDCVLIHVADPRVKAGDTVEAGVTDLAVVRDIESSLTDVQLGFFTPEGVGGNHTHVQMNNADAPEYREKKLEGAVTAA